MKKICISKKWIFSSPNYMGEQTVDLPHDYVVTLPRNKDVLNGMDHGFYTGSYGTYTKYMTFEEAKHTILDIDGAYMCTRIFFNDDLLDMHPHGYTPYLVDLSERIRKGRNNKIKLETLHLLQSSRWYSGSGVYRDVFVWTGGNVRIEPWDLFVSTKCIDAENKKAELSVNTCITADYDCDAQLIVQLYDAEGVLTAEEHMECGLQQGKNDSTGVIRVDHPQLWSCETPYLYTLKAYVKANGVLEDTFEKTVGIRLVEVNPKEGFLLNGVSMKLQGGCLHHDHGGLGSAEFPAAVERKIRLLKEAGFNAVRSAHNPPSLVLLETCDRLGMLLMDEAFDMWNLKKREADYSLWFRDWWQRDLSYMVLRDRNHPCVISYSIGNEVDERNCRSEGASWSLKLAEEVRKYDRTRPVTAGVCGMWDSCDENAPEDYREDYMMGYRDTGSGVPGTSWDKRTESFMKPLDMVGYNYLYYRYGIDSAAYPERVIWGSESKSLEFYDTWQGVCEHPNVIGDFTWTAWDNMGEVGIGRFRWAEDECIINSSFDVYPARSSYQGDFDLAGYRRPQSYFREAVWKNITPPHIFTTHPRHNGDELNGVGWHWYDVSESWTFEEEYIGEPVKTEVYTTADEVIFELNGAEVGRAVPVKGIASVQIPYEKGEVCAIPVKNGMRQEVFSLKTTGKAYKIRVVSEKSEVAADYRDLCYFNIYIEDKNGNLVTDAQHELTCQVMGGELMCIFSGDPKNEDQYGSNVCHAYEGKAVAAVRCKNPGMVMLYVHSDGLKGGISNAVNGVI